MSNSVSLTAKEPVVQSKSSRRGETLRVARLLNRFVAGQRKTFLAAFVMLLAESATSTAQAFPLAYVVGYLAGEQPDLQTRFGFPVIVSQFYDPIIVATIALVLLALLNSIADSLAEIFLALGGRRLGFTLRSSLFAHLQKLSLAFYNQRRTGDLLTRVTSDVTALEDFSINSLKDIAGSIFLLIITIATLLVTSWEVALITVVMLPPLALISNYFSERIKSASKRQRSSEGEMAAATQEMLTSIRVIQTYGRGGYEHERFAGQSKNTMDVALEAARIQAWFSGVINVLQSVVIAVVIWVGVWLISRSQVSLATLVLVVPLIEKMFKPTKRIIKEWNSVGKIFASVERINELLERRPAVEDAPNARPAPRLKGYIEFRRVSFAYEVDPQDRVAGAAAPGAPRLALNNFDLSIGTGEVIALVGSSGAGKSTIVQLLPRLYDPHAGQVRIDGHDIREWTLDSLRGQISVVLQDTILFNGTVANNIAYGRTDATRDEIMAAAIQANAHDFIMKLPNGYDTVLSERAANLSGGQRQRIAIARAFIRNTPILLLDEPTTGLDAESTDLVLSALKSLMKGKTTIIISHDLNLIRDADRIVVIKEGQVEQLGTHQTLLRAGGLYAQLYNKQFGLAESSARDSRAQEADDAGDTPTPVQEGAFRSLLSQALPAPVNSKTFQTIMLSHTLVPADALATPAQRPAQPAPADAPAARAGASAAGSIAAPPVASPPSAASPAAASAPSAVSVKAPLPQPAERTTAPESRSVGAESRPHATTRPTFSTTLMPILSEQPDASATATVAPPAPVVAARTSATIAIPRPSSLRPPRDLTAADIDLEQSPVFQQALPTFRTVMDVEALRPKLQATLFGQAPARATIVRCELEKASYEDEDSCELRYEVEYQTPDGARATTYVNGYLFPTAERAAAMLRERLAPLSARTRSRPEFAAFVRPAGLLESLNMAVAVFPIDAELPMLPDAVDVSRVAPILNAALPAYAGNAPWRVEFADYGRQRATLRYSRGAGAKAHVVYGKLHADDSAALTGPVVTALRAHVLRCEPAFRFNIPSSLGWQPELRLALLDSVPGSALLTKALAGKLAADATISLEAMVDAYARIAVVLHTSAINAGPRRTFSGEIEGLYTQAAAVVPLTPALGGYMQDLLGRIDRAAERIDPLPLSFCHGDYSTGQVLFDGASPSLIDFDRICQAEPALDLGQFLAYVRISGAKRKDRAPEIEALCRRFMDVYIGALGEALEDEERLRRRVALYEALALARRALQSWRKFKASRVEAALDLLEERMAWL